MANSDVRYASLRSRLLGFASVVKVFADGLIAFWQARKDGVGGVDQPLRDQFDYERAAAKRLLAANKDDRPALYRHIYQEFYARFGSSPHMADGDSEAIESQFEFVRRFVRAGRDDFVEVGSGSGKLCVEIAKIAKSCIGIDTAGRNDPDVPANCTFLVDDLVAFSLPDESVDVAFSSQLLEHLHPDDAKAVIGKIFRTLRPGGLFVNITPNWLTGPHDVSAHFGPKAQGLHLHEYDNGELAALMRASGFAHCTSYIGAKGFFIPLPSAVIAAFEKGLRVLPRTLRRQAPVRAFVGIRMTARKPA